MFDTEGCAILFSVPIWASSNTRQLANSIR
jgi:hypothetical protein